MMLRKPLSNTLSAIESEVATNLPVSTRAPRPKYTPLALSRMTSRSAVSEPNIKVGSALQMRFNADTYLVGSLSCEKCTLCPAPMLKLSQLITARSTLPWSKVAVLPCTRHVTLPLAARSAEALPRAGS